MRRQRERHVGVGALESQPIFRQAVDRRRQRPRFAVRPNVIGAKGIDRHQQNVRAAQSTGRKRLRILRRPLAHDQDADRHGENGADDDQKQRETLHIDLAGLIRPALPALQVTNPLDRRVHARDVARVAVAWGLAREWTLKLGHTNLWLKLGEVFLPMLFASLIYFGLCVWLKVSLAEEVMRILRGKIRRGHN